MTVQILHIVKYEVTIMTAGRIYRTRIIEIIILISSLVKTIWQSKPNLVTWGRNRYRQLVVVRSDHGPHHLCCLLHGGPHGGRHPSVPLQYPRQWQAGTVKLQIAIVIIAVDHFWWVNDRTQEPHRPVCQPQPPGVARVLPAHAVHHPLLVCGGVVLFLYQPASTSISSVQVGLHLIECDHVTFL